MQEEKINPRGKANFALGPEYLDLLDQMSKATMLKKTAILRILLDVGAKKLGLDPINDVPKALAPTS